MHQSNQSDHNALQNMKIRLLLVFTILVFCTVGSEPVQYTINYNVEDDTAGLHYNLQEIRGDASASGQYNVVLPGGSSQSVSYNIGHDLPMFKPTPAPIFRSVPLPRPFTAPAIKAAPLQKPTPAPLLKSAPLPRPFTPPIFKPAPIQFPLSGSAPVIKPAPIQFPISTSIVKPAPIRRPIATPPKPSFITRLLSVFG